MRLYVCGSRGTAPVSGAEYLEFGGATTCYILRDRDSAVVIDCGTGLQAAGPILAGCQTVEVLLTHVHYDHILGLLRSGSFPPYAKVRFLSAFDRWLGEETLKRFLSPPFWPVTPRLGQLVTVHPPERVRLAGGFTAEFRDTAHPGSGMLIQLCRGGRKISILWDYEDGTIDLDAWIQGSDLLCYDGMYDDEEYPTHATWGHSSWQSGCRMAKRCGVSRLVISHHAPEHDDRWLRQSERRAAELFSHTRFARSGDIFELEEATGHGV